MPTISIQEAQAKLETLIDALKPGESIVLTRADKPVATLTAEAPAAAKPRQAGACRGMMTIISDDDEHLKDFAEYMQ